MKTFLLALCLLSVVACTRRSAPPPPAATVPALPEFAGIYELYRQFQEFRNDRLFLRYGFTANFPQADWLEHVRRQERNPELAERARLLANLAVASRIHGNDGMVTRNFEERFTASLLTPGPALPPAAPDRGEIQTAAGAEPPPNPPRDSAAPLAIRNNAPAAASDADRQTPAMPEQLVQTPALSTVPHPDKATAKAPAVPSSGLEASPSTADSAVSAGPAQGPPPGRPSTNAPAAPVLKEAMMRNPTATAPPPAALAQESPADGPITILFTGDTQGVIYPQPGITGTVGGLARRPPVIESVKAANPSLVLLDAGDAFASGFPRAEIVNTALVRAMNRMRYDAMGLGPHDLAMGESALRELANVASFPMICSNLEFQEGSTPWIKPYALLERGRYRIAVISLFFPDTAVRMTGARFVAPQPALRRLLPQLAPQADAIVLMTQAGSEEIAAMLDQGADVDVILGDARSTSLSSPKYIPGVAKGLGMGLVELRRTSVSSQASRTIPLLSSGELDSNILKIIDTLPK